jgi:lysophospholipase L1-like esterase
MNIRLLILMAFTLLSACGSDGSSSSGGGASTNPDPDKKNLIVVIGDSIGIGFRASIAFPDIINSMTGIPVTNSSSPGISAAEGAGRAQTLIDQFNPRYLVVLLGTNDAIGGGSGVEVAIGSLQTIAQICVNNGVVCVFGTLPPITASSLQNADALAISSGIRGIGSARIADFALAMDASHIGDDGIHPNDSGQRLIGQGFSNHLP